MKIFNFLFFILLFTTAVFAQNAPINFETGGNGANWTWAVFENDTNPPLEIIDNPAPAGINTSAKVAKFTALQTGNPWAGCESKHGTDLGPFVLNESNSTIKIMVWKSVISDVGIKLVAASGWAMPELKVANTKVNEWEELTFNFSVYMNPPAAEGQYDQIVIFPDFNLAGRGQMNIIYFDNITFNQSSGTIEGPATAAPTPTRNAADVISMFSDAYTDVPVDTWRTDWSVGILGDITINGNPTKRYALLDAVGVETVTNQINATEMTHLHLDVWSSDFTFFGIKLVDFGADGAFGGGDDSEHQVNFTSPIQGQWLSLDIPLSEFASLAAVKNLAQFIFVGQPSGATTVYIDNVYFYKPGSGGGTPKSPINFEPGGFGADWTWSVFENATNPPLEIIDNPAPAGINTSSKVAKFTALQAGNPWAGTESAHGTTDLGPFVLNETNSTIKIMVWKSVISDVGIKLVASSGWAQPEKKVANTKINEWEELTFNFMDYINPPESEGQLDQIVIFPDFNLSGRTQSNVVYFDNITFNPTTTVSTEDDLVSQNQIKIFPNPVQSGSQLFSSNEVEQMEVLDISGKIIMQTFNTSSISTVGLNQGVYILRVRTNNNQLQTRKLIVK